EAGGGNNTINIQSLASDQTINVQGSGSDTVNIGFGGSVQGITGAVNIENPLSYSTVYVDDSADTNARTATLDTFQNPGDSEGNNEGWGQISGLAPGTINYEYADTGSVTIKTGDAATVSVLATGVTTNLIGTNITQTD